MGKIQDPENHTLYSVTSLSRPNEGVSPPQKWNPLVNSILAMWTPCFYGHIYSINYGLLTWPTDLAWDKVSKKLLYKFRSFSNWQHCITYLRFLVKWNRMATCKTTHRNDCWITRSAREGDPEDKVNNYPNFLRVNKLLIESRIKTRNGLPSSSSFIHTYSITIQQQ